MLLGVDGHIKVSWNLSISCIDRKLTVCEVCSAILVLLLPSVVPVVALFWKDTCLSVTQLQTSLANNLVACMWRDGSWAEVHGGVGGGSLHACRL